MLIIIFRIEYSRFFNASQLYNEIHHLLNDISTFFGVNSRFSSFFFLNPAFSFSHSTGPSEFNIFLVNRPNFLQLRPTANGSSHPSITAFPPIYHGIRFFRFSVLFRGISPTYNSATFFFKN